LVMASNSGDSSASALTWLLSGEYPTTFKCTDYVSSSKTPLQLTSKLVSVITSRHGPRRKHRFQQFLYCCARTHCRGNLSVSWSLPNDGSTHYNTYRGGSLVVEFEKSSCL
jgi:hypothetical protein